MSNYCGTCVYRKSDAKGTLRARTGEKACPFNYFYWNFLIGHQDQLRSQGRMSLILGHLKRLSTEEINTIQFKV